MVTSLTAEDLVAIGVNIWRLKNPDRYHATQYRQFTYTLVDLLERGEFKHALSLAKPLLEEIDSIVHTFVNLEANYKDKHADFVNSVTSIDRIVTGECKARTLILTDIQPPQQLSQLRNLQPHQQRLLDDLIICFRSRLARPAIVVAWSLGYDVVRWWIFSDPHRTIEFNNLSKVGMVNDYKDSFLIGERQLLDVCWRAQGSLKGYTEKPHRALLGLLDDRNKFAHANDKDATINRAKVYVEQMVDIITSDPFDK